MASKACGLRQMIHRSGLYRAIVFLCIALAPAYAQSLREPEAKHARGYTFKVVRQYPHDSSAFTQGLACRDGFFYEGTGLTGQSSLRQVRIATGEVVRRVNLPPDIFGEGITLLNNQVVQLTWLSKTGFVYDLKDFHLLRKFSYSGEGWGLATDGHDLFMSDGSSEIRVLDSKTFIDKRRIKVRDNAHPIEQLNELEFVAGEIFANVWHTERIARISPRTGQVLGWIDLTGLLSPIYHVGPEAVLNGIAYDSRSKRLFVTGKLWPQIFEIKILPKKLPRPEGTGLESPGGKPR
jgi:glutamine cyclotransferase